MNSLDTVSPDLLAAWEQYIQTYFAASGITSESSDEERLKAYEEILEEAENGLTITPDGKQVYIDLTVPDEKETNLLAKGGGAREKTNPNTQKRTLAIYGGLVLACILALVVLFGLKDFSLDKISFKKSTPTPTPETVETVVVPDYSVLLKSYDGSFYAKYDVPSVLTYRGVQFLVSPSDDKKVKNGEVWCAMPRETVNLFCWLQGSLTNVVLGTRYELWDGYFSQALPGETIELRFGGRVVNYTIREIKEVPFTETTILSQQEAALTLVFFDKTDEMRKPLGTDTRQILIAVPSQDGRVQSSTGGGEQGWIEYAGDNTLFTVGGQSFEVLKRSSLQGEQSYRLVYYFSSETAPLDILRQYEFRLRSGADYLPVESSLSSFNGRDLYRVVFLLPSYEINNRVSLLVSNGTETYGMSDILTETRGLENFNFIFENTVVQYTPSDGLLKVQVEFWAYPGTESATCQTCTLFVNEIPILPQQPAVFDPSVGKAEIVFRVDLTKSAIPGLKLVLDGNVLYFDLPQQ